MITRRKLLATAGGLAAAGYWMKQPGVGQGSRSGTLTNNLNKS